eukprot:12812033-Alexandrium_andersonii.AAC.1
MTTSAPCTTWARHGRTPWRYALVGQRGRLAKGGRGGCSSTRGTASTRWPSSAAQTSRGATTGLVRCTMSPTRRVVGFRAEE